MTLFLLGLVVGALFGCLYGKAAREPLPDCRTHSSNFSFGSPSLDRDPVSDLMNEMQTGVSLIAARQRNHNLREATAIRTNRRKLERDYSNRFSD